MDYPPPHAAPARPRRRRWIVAAAAALVVLAGAGVAVAAVASGSHHRSASPHATPAAAATTDSAASDGPTCKQFEDSDTGGYDLGEPTNAWAGHLLADLIGADGIAMQLNGLTQMGFALDLRQACLDPSVFDTPAKVIGAAVYRANKTKYTQAVGPAYPRRLPPRVSPCARGGPGRSVLDSRRAGQRPQAGRGVPPLRRLPRRSPGGPLGCPGSAVG
jgi:hypothetical protein